MYLFFILVCIYSNFVYNMKSTMSARAVFGSHVSKWDSPNRTAYSNKTVDDKKYLICKLKTWWFCTNRHCKDRIANPIQQQHYSTDILRNATKKYFFSVEMTWKHVLPCVRLATRLEKRAENGRTETGRTETARTESRTDGRRPGWRPGRTSPYHNTSRLKTGV